MLGPMVNIARVPMGGRNFESYGEVTNIWFRLTNFFRIQCWLQQWLDLLLMESNLKYLDNILQVIVKGVIATVKHYVDNNQEYNRTLVSENVPERAQWEIYYPAFYAAVEAGQRIFSPIILRRCWSSYVRLQSNQ